VDEAHYIKNPEARRTMNVKNLSRHASRTLFMTGTALENKVDEMIALIKMLQPRIAAQVQGMAFMSAATQFREKVAPVYYRRKRVDVLTELPELIESKEWCTLLPDEERLYEQAVLGKHYADARRVSWNVDDLNNSSKAKRLLEIVNEAELEERKVIVFSFFLDTIRKITMLLGNRCLNPINGSVTPQRRQEIIDEFSSAPAGTVLAAQIESGGTGLNIQAASVIVICEPQFKPSTEKQAISRAHRMGQTRNVLVYRLLCENTVDEKITATLENKQAIFDAFADKSVAASQSVDVDDKTFGDIIKEEIDRINNKYGKSNTNKKTGTEDVS
jgi:SNF2 family DNA or RNA helicase